MLEIVLLIVFAPLALIIGCQILAAIFNPLFNPKKKYDFRSVSDPGPRKGETRPEKTGFRSKKTWF